MDLALQYPYKSPPKQTLDCCVEIIFLGLCSTNMTFLREICAASLAACVASHMISTTVKKADQSLNFVLS